ncbi:MAG: Ig-like domain-containing protein [Spirochaetes bacterium]|nr:Ig-like domain-containing protein [Spirochaetota bacterium]
MNKVKMVILFILTISISGYISCSKFTTLKVVTHYPANGQYGVLTNDVVYIEFNNDVNKSDIAKSFFVSSNTGNIEGNTEWLSGKSFNYIPFNEMNNGERYVISIPKSVRDTDGNKMEQDFISEFYVGDDLVKPHVENSYPVYTEGGTRNVPIYPEYLSIVFSESMNRIKTEEAFTISPYTGGYFSWNTDSTEVRYMITAELDYGSQYKMSVSQAAEDISGNKLESTYSVLFITGDDFIFPEVEGIYQAGMPQPVVFWDTDNINQVSKTIDIAVQFSESMSRSETESAFSTSPPIDGLFTWNAESTILTFSPTEDLNSETMYILSIGTSAKDDNGWKLQQEYQLTILTADNDSLNISPGDVYGTYDHDNIAYALLNLNDWPVGIEMGPVADPLSIIPAEFDYFFRLQFVNDNGAVTMTPYSIYDNLLVEGFGEQNDPVILDIFWDINNVELYIQLGGLSNDIVSSMPVLYRLTIIGGQNGIEDINGNTMPDNFSFEFRE